MINPKIKIFKSNITECWKIFWKMFYVVRNIWRVVKSAVPWRMVIGSFVYGVVMVVIYHLFAELLLQRPKIPLNRALQRHNQDKEEQPLCQELDLAQIPLISHLWLAYLMYSSIFDTNPDEYMIFCITCYAWFGRNKSQ